MNHRPCYTCSGAKLEYVASKEPGIEDHYVCPKCFATFKDEKGCVTIYKSRTKRIRAMKGKK